MSTEVLVAIVGVGSTIIGAVIVLVGEVLRDRAANEREVKKAAATRERESWQMSQPAAQRAQDFLSQVITWASPRSWQPGDDQQPTFEESFPEWWETEAHNFEREVSLIPNEAYRVRLGTVRRSLEYSWGLMHFTDHRYAQSHQAAALQAARVGFEIVATWRRGGGDLDAGTLSDYDALAAALKAVDDYAEEFGDSGSELPPRRYTSESGD